MFAALKRLWGFSAAGDDGSPNGVADSLKDKAEEKNDRTYNYNDKGSEAKPLTMELRDAGSGAAVWELWAAGWGCTVSSPQWRVTHQVKRSGIGAERLIEARMPVREGEGGPPRFPKQEAHSSGPIGRGRERACCNKECRDVSQTRRQSVGQFAGQ